jgi:hypothetical protein
LDTLQRAWQRDGQLAHWLRRSTKWHMVVRWLIDHLLFLDAMTFFWTVKMEVIYVLLPVIGISWRRAGGAPGARAARGTSCPMLAASFQWDRPLRVS